MRQISKSKVLGAALVFGLVAAALIVMFLKQANVSQQKELVVTASKSIPRGTVIGPDMVETRSVAKKNLPEGTVGNASMVVGKVTTTWYGAGDPISIQSLAAKDRLSYAVPQFMRAVTVAIDPIIGVGGFLKPGDHVDVIATFDVNDGTLTKTVLQNVQLLATGGQVVEQQTQTTQSGNNSTRAVEQPNATLAVRPMDAEKLVLADSKGKIRLALRRADDLSYITTKGITGRSVMGVVPPDAPEEKTQAAAQVASAPAPESASAATSREMAAFFSKFASQQQPAPLPKVEEGIVFSGESGSKIEVVRGAEKEQVVVPD